MSNVSQRATLDDLMGTEGKAELIGGRIVQFMASGEHPGTVAFNIAVSLRSFGSQTRLGRAYADGVGFAIPELPSGRESFSPDAAFHSGPRSANLMRFIQGPPTFAVEVRSENDYTASAEVEIAAKRADYFAAGTLVVWDVDPIAETIDRYRASDPSNPVRFQRGQSADAEPAVPGWRISVDEVFDEV